MFKIQCQGSTYLVEVMSGKFILLQHYVGRIKMKTYSPTNFSSQQNNIFFIVDGQIIFLNQIGGKNNKNFD